MGSRMSFGGLEPQRQRRNARRERLPRADGRGRAVGQVARPGGVQLPFPGARQNHAPRSRCPARGGGDHDAGRPHRGRRLHRGAGLHEGQGPRAAPRRTSPGRAGTGISDSRAHIGVDAGSGLVHAAETTAANVSGASAAHAPREGGRRVLPCGPRPHGRGGAPRGRLRAPSLPGAPDHRQEALRQEGPGLRAPGREGHRVQEGIRPLQGGASLPHREAPVRAPEDALQRGPEELLHALRILRPRRSRRAHPGGQVPRLPPRSCLRGSGTPCRMHGPGRACRERRPLPGPVGDPAPMPSRGSVRTRAAAAPEGH